MVIKSKEKTSERAGKKGRIKSLNLKRETVKDLTAREQKEVKAGGGLAGGVLASGEKRAAS